ATDAVLAVHEQPERRKPLLKANRGVFEDGPDLQRELRFGMLPVALVAADAGKVGDVLAPPGRAPDDAVRPSDRVYGLTAVFIIREEQNCFAESLGRFRRCHERIMAES